MNTFYDTIIEFLHEKGIDAIAPLDFCHCRIINERLLERSIPTPKTAILFLIPYYTGDSADRNISLYAVPRDYHLFAKELKEEITALLSKMHPEGKFAVFADHSPIDERDAAGKCGLGVIGDNHLLINEIYGSYVFLASILTDLSLPMPARAWQTKSCLHCGACKEACPSPSNCLSAITQRKGDLTAEEKALMQRTGTIWGCDVCQTVCPMNESIKPSPIPFFREKRIPRLTKDVLDGMSDEEFSTRAFSWRGRAVVERNLKIFAEDKD